MLLCYYESAEISNYRIIDRIMVWPTHPGVWLPQLALHNTHIQSWGGGSA